MRRITSRFCFLAATAALLLPNGCRTPRTAAERLPPPPESPAVASKGDIDELRAVIDRAADCYRGVRDYRCIFHKRHRIGGSLQDPQRIFLKFMEPMSIYMKWIEGRHEGQEILYAPARYGEKGFARAGGWKGQLMPVIRVDVDGYWVRRDSIHDLDHVGIGYFLNVFMENSRRARKTGEGTLIDRGEDIVCGRPVRVIEAVLPREKEKGYYCRRCIVSFDKEHGLPVKIQVYDWDDNLAEEYVYEGLELNVGLSEKDFDRENKEYRF